VQENLYEDSGLTYYEAAQPACKSTDGEIELTIRPKLRDLGEISVRGVLPARERRMVGPFIFFDHMGPAEFPPGKGISVRPHPHIGISTITYLFDGQIMHRDSLGYAQLIKAGAVNLMTAGRGIVHSERAGDDLDKVSTLHGIQSWIALPYDDEETAAEFIHYPADTLPDFDLDGVRIRVIIGNAFGHESPIAQYSPTLYLECLFKVGAELTLPDDEEEIALYVVSGRIKIGDESYTEGTMAVACNGHRIHVAAQSDSRVMVIGGSSLRKRHIWWNFVSCSKERIEKAKKDWTDGQFDSVPGDDEFIPLPER